MVCRLLIVRGLLVQFMILTFNYISFEFLQVFALQEDSGLDYYSDGPIVLENIDGPLTFPVPPSTDIDWENLSFNDNEVRDILVEDMKALFPAMLHTLEIAREEISPLTRELWPEAMVALSEIEDIDVRWRGSSTLKQKSTAGQQTRCSIMAGVTRQAYMIAARRFETLNQGGGNRLETSAMYFLYPLFPEMFDSLDSDRGVQVYYNAEWVSRRFWDVPAVTFGHQVYIRDQEQLSSNLDEFLDQVLLLAHEISHLKQYGEYDFSLRKFAHAYLYNWCLAGRSRHDNKMEVRARETAENLASTLMTDDNLLFFEFWDRDNQHHSLGFPTKLNPQNIRPGWRELEFQKGKMQIRVTDECYRVLSYDKGIWSPWNCQEMA